MKTSWVMKPQELNEAFWSMMNNKNEYYIIHLKLRKFKCTLIQYLLKIFLVKNENLSTYTDGKIEDFQSG